MTPGTRTALSQIFTGVITFVIACILLSYLDYGIAVLLFAPVPVIAGYLRVNAKEHGLPATIILINILFFLFFLPVLNGMFHFLAFPFTGIIGTFLGAYIRHSLKRPVVILLSSVYTLVILSLSFYALPVFFDAMMWKEEVKAAPPEYQLLTLKGDTIHSRTLHTKVIVLDFWASWCGPCKKEFPELEKIYTKYKNNKEVVFFAVNVDGKNETHEKASRFISESGLDLPFVFDIKASAAKKFQVQGLPTIIIMDKYGVVRYIHQGYEGSENFRKTMISRLDALLN